MAYIFDYEIINEPVRAVEVVKGIIAQAPEAVAFDTETTGLDPYNSDVHSFSLATEDMSWSFTGDAVKASASYVNKLFKNVDIIMHNATFDLPFAKKLGIVPRAKVLDTLIASWLCDENRDNKLKTLAKTRLNITDELPDFKALQHEAKKRLKKKKLEDVSIWDFDQDVLGIYSARDTRLTYDLWLRIKNDLVKEKQTENFYNFKIPFINIMCEMETSGFLIDTKQLEKVTNEFTKFRDEAKAKVLKVYPDTNLNSTDQLGKILFGKKEDGFLGITPTIFTASKTNPKPSTKKLALLRANQKDTTGIVAQVLVYKKYVGLISSFLKKIKVGMDDDGRLRTNFNMTGTKTGRLSSSGKINLQNQPVRHERGEEIRKIYIPAPGCDLLVVDYSQLELRIIAHYSKEPVLLKLFEENGDPHQLTADLVGDIPRWMGKTINFASAYGGGPVVLANTVEEDERPRPSQRDAKMWLKNFWRGYPQYARWKKRATQYAYTLGHIRTIGGRKRRLPGLYSEINTIKWRAERQALNAIIQGSAGDIMERAMLDAIVWIHWYGGKLLVQVHDELVIEVKKEYSQILGQKVKEAMENAGKYFELRVDLVAEPGIGKNWYDAK